MCNDIDWGRRGNKGKCLANAHRIAEYGRRFSRGHLSFLGPGSEKKWYGTHVSKLAGQWDKTAEDVMLDLAESGHPIFRATSALERGALKSKGKEINPFTSTVAMKPLN